MIVINELKVRNQETQTAGLYSLRNPINQKQKNIYWDSVNEF